MKSKLAGLAVTLAILPFGAVQADDDFVRDIISSGLTTASTYLTFKDDKLIVAAQVDAGSFVASDGQIRGPYLEAALRQLRETSPQLQASDMELASAILASQNETPARFGSH
ncbi:MAG: ribonucleotide reductase [Pseudomonadales bacterium GWC1_66_9]|nr:MAG: ribonucleotide reductase [Pseudomonadales bacterium GWC1_66_9]